MVVPAILFVIFSPRVPSVLSCAQAQTEVVGKTLALRTDPESADEMRAAVRESGLRRDRRQDGKINLS